MKLDGNALNGSRTNNARRAAPDRRHGDAEKGFEFAVEKPGHAAGLPVLIGDCVDDSSRPALRLSGQPQFGARKNAQRFR